MGYPVDFEKGELNRGNWKRIKKFQNRAFDRNYKRINT